MFLEDNFAYIDGANLHKGVADLGWKLDYKRFRVWLKEKYSVKTAYLNDQKTLLGLYKRKNPR